MYCVFDEHPTCCLQQGLLTTSVLHFFKQDSQFEVSNVTEGEHIGRFTLLMVKNKLVYYIQSLLVFDCVSVDHFEEDDLEGLSGSCDRIVERQGDLPTTFRLRRAILSVESRLDWFAC